MCRGEKFFARRMGVCLLFAQAGDPTGNRKEQRMGVFSIPEDAEAQLEDRDFKVRFITKVKGNHYAKTN